MDFKIVNAGEDELEQLIELYIQGYKGLEEYSYTNRKDVKAYIRWLWKRDRYGIFIAKAQNRVIGFIACDSKWFSKKDGGIVGAIHEIVVDPEFRRKGVGLKLIKTAIEYLKKKNLQTVELWVGDENIPARKLYEKVGFKYGGQYNYWVRMAAELEKLVFGQSQ